MTGYISVFTNERGEGGFVNHTASPPQRPGIDLFATEGSILPPLNAVFALGSEAVGRWLASIGWSRAERHDDNFPARDIVREYERVWFQEYPLYREGIFAVLGGWHWPCAHHDWHKLIGEHLLVLTLHDSEPWVETWLLRNGKFKVIQRIT
jgi:hypothetical protein